MAGAATAPTDRSAGDRIGGVFLLAVDPAAFGDPDQYVAATGRVTEAIKRVPPAPGVSAVLVPGEPEARSRAARQAEGIPIPDDTWEAMAATAARVGVEPPPGR